MLQAAADDGCAGRLQGVFIVVVAGGPRIADVAHGAAAAAVGAAAAAAGGGVLVVVGTVARGARRARRSCATGSPGSRPDPARRTTTKSPAPVASRGVGLDVLAVMVVRRSGFPRTAGLTSCVGHEPHAP